LIDLFIFGTCQFDCPITKREKKLSKLPPFPTIEVIIYGEIYSKALWPLIRGKLWFNALK
jgi:hypothetical protein